MIYFFRQIHPSQCKVCSLILWTNLNTCLVNRGYKVVYRFCWRNLSHFCRFRIRLQACEFQCNIKHLLTNCKVNAERFSDRSSDVRTERSKVRTKSLDRNIFQHWPSNRLKKALLHDNHMKHKVWRLGRLNWQGNTDRSECWKHCPGVIFF